MKRYLQKTVIAMEIYGEADMTITQLTIYRITQSVTNGFEKLYMSNLLDLLIARKFLFFSQSVINNDHCAHHNSQKRLMQYSSLEVVQVLITAGATIVPQNAAANATN